MANKKADAAPAKNKVVFSKAKVLTLNRYAGRRDLLAQLLKDGKDYTLDQVDALIQNFMKKGKVK
jgi:hypothetical protein